MTMAISCAEPQQRQRSTPFIKTTLLNCLVCAQAEADLYPSLRPGGNFALENWSITIPADQNGGVSGKAVTVSPTNLSGRYGYSSRWFYTAADGAMTFWTPINGATAGGSSSPRSELREMMDPSNLGVTWDNTGTSFMDAMVRVMQVPSDGIVIIGQAHGLGVAPLVMVYFRYDPVAKTGQVIAKLQGLPEQGLPYTNHVLARGIKLGQAFTYQIKVRHNGSNGIASASVNNGAEAQMVMDHAWDNETFYFKAGSYLHMAGTSSTEGGLVKFYRLAVSHPANGLQIISNAALPNATAERPYSTRLQADGGLGAGTWALVSGYPPARLYLSRDGVISGSPLASKISPYPHTFVVQIKDANGNTYSKKFSILVSP